MDSGIYVYINKETNEAHIDVCTHTKECRNLYYKDITLNSLNNVIQNLQKLYKLEIYTYYSPKE